MMKILHLCLACFYIDGYNYQENVLPRLSSELGHDVKIIASTETYIDNKTIGYVEPKSYTTEYGVPIIRLPYKKVVNHKISSKLRIYIGLYEEIEEFHPDIIFSHDLSFLSLCDVIKYIKLHPNVTLLSDTHTAYYNSGKNWVSLNILHRCIYKSTIKKAIPYVKKVYYVGPSERDFSINIYNIPPAIMEYMPLGGIIPDESVRNDNRKKYRDYLGIKADELLLLHTGKLTREKNTTSLVRAFSRVSKLKAKLVIIGSFEESIEKDIITLINADDRIVFLGWKNSKILLEYLCACDLYCQPGTPSATLQNAVCCGCAVMSREYEIYKMLDQGNFIWVDSEESLVRAFEDICENKINVDSLKNASNKAASIYLDYKKMEEKIRTQAHLNE